MVVLLFLQFLISSGDFETPSDGRRKNLLLQLEMTAPKCKIHGKKLKKKNVKVLFVLFFPMFIFLKMMFSQNDETVVLEFLDLHK